MNKIAFSISKLSELIIEEIIHQSRRNWVDVYTNNYNLIESIESLGVECIYVPYNEEKSKEVRDKKFFDLFMPGDLDGLSLNGFPVWKALSLDRLKFWYSDYYSKYDFPHYDVCYYSLDIMSSFPWVIDADKRIGIKVNSLRTREMVDFLRSGYFDEVIVSFDDELKLADVTKSKGIKRQTKQILNNQSFRDSHAYGKEVVGIIFDKQNDWQYRLFLDKLTTKPHLFDRYYFMAFASDERSAELFYTIGGKLELQPLVLLKNCNKIVDFAFHESIYNNCLGEYVIADYGNINNALATTAGLEEIKVIHESTDIFW